MVIDSKIGSLNICHLRHAYVQLPWHELAVYLPCPCSAYKGCLTDDKRSSRIVFVMSSVMKHGGVVIIYVISCCDRPMILFAFAG